MQPEIRGVGLHLAILKVRIIPEVAFNVKIFSGRATRYLSEKIADSYGVPMGDQDILEFKDGEFEPCFNDSIRGDDVFIVQSTFPPADNLMELLLMIDAAKRASAKRIVAVIPYFGWARQDRKVKPRVPIGAKLTANLLQAAGVTRIMTMDLHADQIQGFFDIPVDHLYASYLFLDYLKQLELSNLVMATPDVGGTRRANAYAKQLNVDLAICYKQRKTNVANVVESMTVIGDVKGKDVVMVDDMVDTGGTLCKAAEMFMEHGANSVRACITHPLLSGDAHDKIRSSKLIELVTTDTIPLSEENDRITVISVADLFSDVIRKAHNYESISSKFIF
ncbi:MAG: ribose-phosphate pyrophosphokinase [Granulosicoccus sp.]